MVANMRSGVYIAQPWRPGVFLSFRRILARCSLLPRVDMRCARRTTPPPPRRPTTSLGS